MAPERTTGEELDTVRRRVGIGLTDLWVDYLGLGGTESPASVDAYLNGRPSLDSMQHDVLAHAINEVAIEQGLNHPAPYIRG